MQPAILFPRNIAVEQVDNNNWEIISKGSSFKQNFYDQNNHFEAVSFERADTGKRDKVMMVGKDKRVFSLSKPSHLSC